MTEQKFIRKERAHLDVLQRRLDYLRTDNPERKTEPGYIPGETGAIAWAIQIIEGVEEPVELRVGRVEKTLRAVLARLGQIEKTLDEEA